LWLLGGAGGVVIGQLAPAPDPVGADATFVDVGDVRVQGVGAGTLSEEQVRGLEVELSKVAGGWVAPRRDLPRQRMRIGELGGASLRLYGSAIESVEDAIALAHARAGRAGVEIELRPGAVSYGGPSQRDLIVELRALDLPAAPAAPDRFGPDAVLVTVRSLALDGAGALEDELLRVAVELSWDEARIPAGWVAPRSGLPTKAVALWELGRFASGGAQLYGSAIQTILEELGEALAERGVHGVTVDLGPGALRRLSTPGSDGLLVLRIVRD
jgi:hypothetical protein